MLAEPGRRFVAMWAPRAAVQADNDPSTPWARREATSGDTDLGEDPIGLPATVPTLSWTAQRKGRSALGAGVPG
jgi:hypothetical protein